MSTDNNKPGDTPEQAPKTEQMTSDNSEQNNGNNKNAEASGRSRSRSRNRKRASNDPRAERKESQPVASKAAADEKVKTEKPASDSKKATESKAKAAPTADAANTGGNSNNASATTQGATWPGKVALLLSLGALGASGFLYWQGMQQVQSIKQQNELLRSEVTAKVDSTISGARSDLSKNIADMNSQLGEVKAQAATDKKNVDELQDRLTRSMKQLVSQQHNSRKDWLLAEVEYLLRLANQRILMENTVSGALKLLKSADKILAETDDVTIYDVRKAVAADIASLEAVPKLDSEGLFLKLGAMNRQVQDLSVTPLSEQHQLPEMLKEITPETVQASWASGLQESWAKAMAKLETLIVVQHRDEPVEPLLSPEQKYYLQQNLNLMLEQAQLALLQRKQESYDSALQKAEEWVSTYFQQDGTAQGLLRGIAELKSVKVAPTLPDISSSLTELKSYLQQMTELKQKGAS
mgnify:CR=1 FL=1